MSHKVLSLKYRPQRFDELKGQGHVTRILQNALASDRVGHAYLLVGPRGVGKTTTARIFARALNCSGRELPTTAPDDLSIVEPCGACASCIDIAAGSDLDVVEMDAASNNAVDDVRALREQVGYATVRSNYRIWIVDEVHMLSLPAFNAFLKTLEEPPAQVKFLFCTTEEHKLPDTFRSRCQRVELRPIGDTAMTERLRDLAGREGVELGDGLAEAIAEGALGGLRDAESQLEQLIAAVGAGEGQTGRALTVADLETLSGRASTDLLARLATAVDEGDAGAALDAVDACLAGGAKPGVLVDQWLDQLRRQMIGAVRGKNQREGAPAGPTAAEGAAAGGGYAKSARAIDILLTKRMHLRAGAAGDIVLQVAAVELARLPDARDLDRLVAALREPGGAPGREPAGRTTTAGGGTADRDPGEAAARGPSRGGPVPAPPRASDAPRFSKQAAQQAPQQVPQKAPSQNAPQQARAPESSQKAQRSPQQGPPRTVDTECVLDCWDEILSRATARNPAVGDALRAGTVRAVRGDTLRLALPDDAARARGTLMRREIQLAFGQVVREVLGTYLRVEIVDALRGTPGSEVIGQDMRQHPAVQQVTEATGGRLLNVERAAAKESGSRPGAAQRGDLGPSDGGED